MNKEKNLISFFGKSGSGKSTAAEMARNYFESVEIKTERIGVAEPLHEMQKSCYGILGIEIGGQDGELLQFLAKHFEKEMLRNFEERLEALLNYRGRLVIINHDCRDNAYEVLRRNGFIFVKIVTDDLIRSRRLNERLDVSRGDVSSELIRADYLIENNGTMEELNETLVKILGGTYISRFFDKI